MNRAEKVRQALIWEAAAKKAYARAARWRDQLTAEARTELAEQGSAPTWRFPEIGTALLPVTQQAVVVVDPDAFLKYVQGNRPDGVETIVRVRPSFQTRLLTQVEADADGNVLDDEGTVVPGLAVRQGGQPMTLRLSPTREASQVLGEAADQVLALVAASLHLPAPPEPDEVPDAEA